MAEARLPDGQKWVFEEDTDTLGWMPVVQVDGTVDGSTVIVSGTTSESWRVALTQDEANNDSDKTFTVPAGQEWQVLWVWVEFASFTGTAANPSRQVEIQLQDAANDVIGAWQPAQTQSNAQTRNYLFAPGLPDLLAFRDTSYLMTPIPPTLFLSAGQQIRIWDNNAVDASNDDMNIQLQYAWRSV